MAIVGPIFGALFLAVPALFCVIPLNYFATKVSVWLRALIATIIPAALFVPIFYGIASGEPPMSEAEWIGVALKVASLQLAIGFIAAFLSARRHPVPEQEVTEDQAQLPSPPPS